MKNTFIILLFLLVGCGSETKTPNLYVPNEYKEKAERMYGEVYVKQIASGMTPGYSADYANKAVLNVYGVPYIITETNIVVMVKTNYLKVEDEYGK